VTSVEALRIFPALTAHLEGVSKTMMIEICLQDEARIGQKAGRFRQGARRGARPRRPADQSYDKAHLFGAIGPANDVEATLALPYGETDMTQLNLTKSQAISLSGIYAVLAETASKPDTVFENYDAIVDAACCPWRKLPLSHNHHIHRNTEGVSAKTV
jgi:hypothetical protein